MSVCDDDPDLRALTSVDFTEFVSSSAWESLLKITKSLLLPEQIHGEDRPCVEGDFDQFKKEVVAGLRNVCNFFQSFAATATNQPFNNDALVWALILCSEHSSLSLWTTEETQSLSTSCLHALCTIHECSSTSQLLLRHSGKSTSSVFRHALLLLRPKLLKDSWRKYPAAVSGYRWMLIQVRSPHLSEYLDCVSPTALIIIDDHDADRRLIGIHCLSHIISHVARTDMCQRGLHLVFYKTLEPILWQRSANLVEPVIICLIKLLSLTQRGYTRNVDPGMWDLFDDTINTLLAKMEFEDQIPLRKAYIKSLSPLLSAMGPSAIRWSKPLRAVFDEYLHKESFDTRTYALQAMSVFIQLSTVRLPQNGDQFLYLLLRTLYDLSLQELADDHDIAIIKEAIKLIQDAAPNEFSGLVEELQNFNCNEQMRSILSECM